MSDNINEHGLELIEIIPELSDMVGFKHNHPYHHLDVWEHTLYALSFAPKDFIIRLALLLHDIGKPHVCTTDKDGVRHFHGHADKSCELTYNILKRLDYSDTLIELICYLVRYHDIPITEKDVLMDDTVSLARYYIQYCDSLAHNPDILYKKEKYLDKTMELFKK